MSYNHIGREGDQAYFSQCSSSELAKLKIKILDILTCQNVIESPCFNFWNSLPIAPFGYLDFKYICFVWGVQGIIEVLVCMR